MPDEFDSPGGNDFSDTSSDVVDSGSFDTTLDSSVDDLSGIMTESVDTSAPVLDDDFYHATPNSEIPILQEDGSVASLEEIMAANAETEDSSLDAVEPYTATPNSDIPILQEDGSVASLEEVMAANAETEDATLDEVEPYTATPNSDIPILQEDGSVTSLEEIMAANAESMDDDFLDGIPPDVSEVDSTGTLDAAMSEDDVERPDELYEVATDGEFAGLHPIDDSRTLLDTDTHQTLDEGSDMTGAESADVGDISEPVSEPIHMTQSDVEWYMENANDPESLRQMRDGIASGRIQVDADTELPTDDAIDEASGPVLTRDPNEQWEIGNNAINDTVEAMRDDLRDKGMEDGPEMEAIVMAERARMQDELTRNINGDFSDPYQKPDFAELMQGEMTDVPAQDIPAVEQAADTVEASDVVADVPQDIDYDAVYSGLDSYDFDGIDYSSDVDRLDSSLENFQNGTWENLSVDEQKAAMSDLADYVKDVIGFDNPPQIVYYNNPVDGDYGGYSPSTNTLEVNEHMLYDNNEAADTIAHELWHAYQHERALNPQSAKDYQYQYGFENYIRPDDDFTAYQDQLVEAEARAFAQQFKDRLSTKRRSI